MSHALPVGSRERSSIIFKYDTSNELFATLDGAIHRSTYSEWQDMGFRGPLVKRGGYVKLSWTPQGIGLTDEMTTKAVGFGDWAAAQYPTAQERGILPGDLVCATETSALAFRGATWNHHVLTYEQWSKTGFKSAGNC